MARFPPHGSELRAFAFALLDAWDFVKGFYDTIDGATKHFEQMYRLDDCLPCGLRGILGEAKHRFPGKGPKISRKQMNEICGYKDGQGVGQTEGLAEDLTLRLREFQMECKEMTAGSGATLQKLQEICEAPDTSFPLVALGPLYIPDVLEVRTVGTPSMEHVVPLLSVSFVTNEVTYVEPLMPRLGKSKTIEESLMTLPLPRFNAYWRATKPPAWLMYFERPKQRTLRGVGES